MTARPTGKRRSVFADRLSEFSDFVFSDGAEFRRRGAWHDFFRNRIGSQFDGRIIFEIGCFDATLLTKVAAKFPSTAFIGLDWKCRAIYNGAGHITEAGLRNVALLNGRAQDLRRIFADGEVDEIWLFHPDPCDKPNELSNRLVCEPFLLDVHQVLRDEGEVVLKTDHFGYYQWTLGLLGVAEPETFKLAREDNSAIATGRERVLRTKLMPPGNVPATSELVVERFDVLLKSADFWNDEAARDGSDKRCFAGETTGFERRFLKKRLPICHLELRKRRAVE